MRNARPFCSIAETRRRYLAASLADRLRYRSFAGLIPLAHDCPAQKIILSDLMMIKCMFDATFVTIISRDHTTRAYSAILLLQPSL